MRRPVSPGVFDSQRMFQAAAKGDSETVELMSIRGGVLINDGDDLFNTTALHFAARGGQAAIVAFLIAQGADIHAVNIVGSTPMHYAAGSNSVDCIRLLAAHGAQIDAMNTEFGATPLHVAASHGHVDAASALLGLGADPTLREKQTGGTPIDVAMDHEHLNVVHVIQPFYYAATEEWTSRASERFPEQLQSQANELRRCWALYRNACQEGNDRLASLGDLPWELIEKILMHLNALQYHKKQIISN